jgi:hypothetical protein
MKIDENTIERITKEELRLLREEDPLGTITRGEESKEVRAGNTRQDQATKGVSGYDSPNELKVGSFLRKARAALEQAGVDLVDGTVLSAAKNLARAMEKVKQRVAARTPTSTAEDSTQQEQSQGDDR